MREIALSGLTLLAVVNTRAALRRGLDDDQSRAPSRVLANSPLPMIQVTFAPTDDALLAQPKSLPAPPSSTIGIV